ncbi:HAD family hydrolase [Baekduia soli]|uniref:HAD family hydrolase n=1 Tax=Baekduia soli TaxID=496014 RepID=A0A5B8U7L8_9ACTN|nr:HAD family hydrolase [Baekduia soli]QEC48672.1 HAD family hydrolase [Baekduia soli]
MPVLFDLNGTLLDAGALTAGWPGAPRGVGLRALDDAVAQAMVDTIGGEFRPFMDYLGAALGHLAAVAGLPEELAEQGLTMARALPPHEDAREALQTLRDAGQATSVLTNSAADGAREALSAGGLLELVDEVVGADAVGVYKPDRRIYEAGVAAAGAPPDETWLVAAHWWDVAGAKRAGLRTAWVGRDEGALLGTVPRPDVLATDLRDAARKILAAARRPRARRAAGPPRAASRPEAGERVGVEVLDAAVARPLVHRLGAGLLGPRVQARDPVAHRPRPVLQRLEQDPSQTAPARVGDHVHALDLAGLVVQALEPSARDGHTVVEDHHERAAGRTEVGRRGGRRAGDVDAAVELGHVDDHRLDEVGRRRPV